MSERCLVHLKRPVRPLYSKILFRFMFSLFCVSSCTLGPGNFESRQSTDLRKRNIRRIAILPLTERANPSKPNKLGTPPVGKKNTVPPAATRHARDINDKGKEAASIMNRHLYATMAGLPQWEIVSDREVREVGPIIPDGSEAAQAKKLGNLVYADAVLFGRLLRYRERVGKEWGAKRPASVSFVLNLWDVKRGDVVWSARFEETQKGLTENLLSLGDFTQRGARWLKAEDLVLDGVKKAVNQLHRTLYPKSNPKNGTVTKPTSFEGTRPQAVSELRSLPAQAYGDRTPGERSGFPRASLICLPRVSSLLKPPRSSKTDSPSLRTRRSEGTGYFWAAEEPATAKPL